MASTGGQLQQSQDSASLVKRLAGPSTTKAGLANDQTEINRIIAEASKGSKFYENEKRKDKDLTERISRVLKQRDDVLRSADIARVERDVEALLVELENKRDLSQIIVHVDMDAFFANVELLYNPSLQGKPFGVGHGVLTTASYEARKFGVRSGMAGFIAKKLCPHLIFVPNHFSRYSEMSDKVMNIFRRYDLNMCPAGTDEAYLNITSYCNENNIDPADCVRNMRSTVFEETKLTVSAGIAPNKMLAKICSDKNKPNGQFHLPFEREAITAFMRDLSIRKIPGIGRVNERMLDSVGIKTCGDIYTYRATVSLMDKQFGSNFLLRTYLGIASNVVQPMQRHERKSIGAERTFEPLHDKESILKKLEAVAAELEEDMRSSGWTGKTVTLKFKLDAYQVFTRAKSLSRWITQKEDLFAIGKELLLPEMPLQLRLIGLRVTKLKDLRALEPIGGIKQFFESACSSKIHKADIGLEPGVVPEFAEQDEDEDAMPGFHEHDENDVGIDRASAEMDSDDDTNAFLIPMSEEDLISPPRRPPHSAPVRTPLGDSSSALSRPQTSTKPRSTNQTRTLRFPPDEAESNTCPICDKVMKLDNRAFNAHVDFCLSRETIREAQSQATTRTKRKSDVANHNNPRQNLNRTPLQKRKKS